MKRRALLGLGLGIVSPLRAAKEKRQNMIPWRAKTLDGETYSLESTKGKVVLIQSWATWCKYCQRDEPAIETILGDHGNEGLVVIAVNAGESPEKVQSYLRTHQRTAKIALLGDTTFKGLFQGTGVPAYVLVDRDGTVASVVEGSGGLPAFREMLREVGFNKK